jgi:hypothetical protein
MASTRAMSMGDRISLAARIASKTIDTPAKITTGMTRDDVDVSEFMFAILIW